VSTFKIESAKIIDGLFPELSWQELDPEGYQKVFEKLTDAGQAGIDIVTDIKQRKIKIGFHPQYKSGGGWTFLKDITLTPGDDPLDPYVLSLIIHETFHLKQSIWMRLSMQGELRAWLYQKQIYPAIAKTKGNEIGAENEAYGGTKTQWDELGTLAPDSREDLQKAREVMQRIAAGYRSDCLPLYPLPREVGFYLTQGKIRESINAVINLLTCS
jgi:hypothetical protein